MENKEIIKEEENVITLEGILDAAKKKSVLLIIVAFIFAVVGVAYAYVFVKTQYTATASIIVTVEPEYPTKTAKGPDGKVYEVKDMSDISAKVSALSYANTIASNSLAFLNSGNDVIYRIAADKYNAEYLQESEKKIKIKELKKNFKFSSQSAQIMFSYKSAAENSDKILKCLIDSFLEKINEKDSDNNAVFGVYEGKMTVLSEPIISDNDKSSSKYIKYAFIFLIVGVAIDFCIAAIVAFKDKSKTVKAE